MNYRHYINTTKYKKGGFYIFKNFKVLTAYREHITELMSSSTFTQKAIENGFIPSSKYFRGNDNWFGVSKQHPDAVLYREKDDKKIILSLNGMFTPYSLEAQHVILECGCKYIAFIKNDVIIYQNWFGEIPSEKFINDFID